MLYGNLYAYEIILLLLIMNHYADHPTQGQSHDSMLFAQ